MKNNAVYKSSISKKLSPFISSLETLIKEYEKVIVGISRSLPEIESQIDDNVLEAKELLNFIFSSHDTDNSYGVKREMDQFHKKLNDALEALEKSENEDKGIFLNLRKSINLSTDTLNKTEEIRDISENLKVFAINSIVYSQKAGNSGKGYQIISSEFIRLSEAIASGTEQINQLGKEMQFQISEFNNLIREHEEFARNHIETISKDSGKLLGNANKSVENFSLILNDLLTRIETVKDPTSQIMNELQKQDIIHQQLQHLMEAMQDILVIINSPQYNSENDSGMVDSDSEEEKNIYTLLGILMKTVESQITRISKELYEMIDGLEVLFDNMNSSISDINSDKDHFSQLVNNNEGGDEDTINNTSIVNIIFKTPRDMIGKIEQDLRNSMGRKQRIIECFSGIEDQIREERDLALTFIPVIDSINNLLILARIEQARYNLNISSLDESSEQSFFSSKIYSKLAGIVEEIESSYNSVTENLGSSRDSFEVQGEDFKSMGEKLNASLSIIDKTREMFIDNFNMVISITNELFNQAEQHIKMFKTLRNLVGDITEKIHICTEIKKRVDSELEVLGGPVKLEESIFKDVILQNIVKRCTVENERITLAEEFEEFDIEGSTSNNITLF